jgi:hypothetical protein
MPWKATDSLTPTTKMALPDGLYDLLLTEGLARSLAAIDPGSADVLALKGAAADFIATTTTASRITTMRSALSASIGRHRTALGPTRPVADVVWRVRPTVGSFSSSCGRERARRTAPAAA